MKNFSITTKKGDDGTTGLLDNSRVQKYDLRPETYGTLDEAAAFLGLARAKSTLARTKEILLVIQNHLYLINAELACPVDSLHVLKYKISTAHLQQLETFSASTEKELALPRKFVLYGQSESSAYLDIARAVVRRAERRFVELNQIEKLDHATISAYLNRLSDTLFLLARYEEYRNGIPFVHPDDSNPSDLGDPCGLIGD
ncbi:cob(I)yrinic acid a,c-diamide adenosyltransferase [candidate division KSB1 bacterium]|nr:cob(I)yrinic acid a,c-diamide adenosyltransferase [candidate division KSB1 bacterium]RQW01806.1 MAG: cob(I)yrinic acid a,c-diamide adenosyltransferase [candidate division KSB1 bacterium]